MSDFKTVLDQSLFIAGAQPGSQLYDYAHANLSDPTSVKNALANTGMPISNENDLRIGLSKYVQTLGRTAPRSARVSKTSPADRSMFTFGEDKTNYFIQAYDDVISGRADSLKGKYADFSDIKKGSVPSMMIDVANKMGSIALDSYDRATVAPFALAIAGMTEAAQSTGVSEEVARDFYNSSMKNLDWISLASEVVLAVYTMGATVPGSGLRHLKKLGSVLDNWLTKNALDGTEVGAAMATNTERNVVKRAVDISRGFMVMNVATTSRNFLNVIGRKGIDQAVSGLMYAMDKTVGSIRRSLGIKDYTMTAAQAAAPTKTFLKMTTGLGGGGKYWEFFKEINQVFPKQTDGLLTKYAGDLGKVTDPTMVDKLMQAGNYLNWQQERFHRGIKFMSVLDDELRDYGVKNGVDALTKETYDEAYSAMRLKAGRSINVGDIPADIVQRASNEALYHTFAMKPTGGWGKFYDFFDKTPVLGTLFKATAIPFPRFATNALMHMYDYNPVQSYRILKLFSPKPLAKADMANMAKHIVGLTGTALAYEGYNAGMYGDNWHELKIGDRTVDIKAMLGPYALPFQIGHLVGKMGDPNVFVDTQKEIEDLANNALVLPTANELGITQLSSLVDGITNYFKDADQATPWNEIVTGDYSTGNPAIDKGIQQMSTFMSSLAARYLVPMNTVKELLSSVSPDMDVKREVYASKNSVNIAPIMNQIPYLNRFVPPKYIPTRAGEYTNAQDPYKIGLRLAGLPPVDKNFVESQLEKMGLNRVGPRKSGVMPYDYMMAERTGQYMQSYSNWLKTDPMVGVTTSKGEYYVRRYSKLADDPTTARAIKRVFLERLVNVATDYADRDVQYRLALEGRKDVLEALKYSRVSKSVVDMRRALGYNMVQSLGGLSKPAINSDQLTRYQVEKITPSHEYTPE